MKLLFSTMPNYEVFLLGCILNSVCGRMFNEEAYFPGGFYDNRGLYDRINKAVSKLENAPQWVNDWPDSSIKLGQVSGLAIDNAGQLLVFHRANHVWDENTFFNTNLYRGIGKPPIAESTILVINETGQVVDKWGENLFYIPHGITVDSESNVWVTDVAMHQVFKFTPNDRQKPALVLGEKFVPGDDNSHFCKPSAVAVLSNGDFFVSDGYCNHRIIKYSPDGKIILQWGTSHGRSPFVFNVPHALTLAEDKGLVCVADRERGRVACFHHDSGAFDSQYSNWLIGGRLFSVAYSPIDGGRLYVVNGPSGTVPVRGYVIDMTSGRLIETFAPDEGLKNPHDIVVSPDGSRVYVAELDPHTVHKFVDEGLRNTSKMESNVTVPVKPTATVELGAGGSRLWWGGAGGTAGGAGGTAGGTGGSRQWWSGAAGGAGGAAAAALLALAALALLRARNTGRKGVPRRRWEYGNGEFKLRRLLDRRRFTRVHSEDSDEEPAPMLPPTAANA